MIELVHNTPIAKVYGEPFLEVPQDLYIPPDALEVFLEQFEGPLDLLLYLIRKENISVLDVPMAQLTRQYLEYVEMMREHQLELAAEYLLMAALLIEIKSRMLLPRPPASQTDEADPRAELVRRLLEYEQMKLAAQRLDALPRAARDFVLVQVIVERESVERFPDVDAEDLRAAWLTLLARAKAIGHHKVTRDHLSVREHMSVILRRLQEHRFIEFSALFDASKGVPNLIVTFLALLELARETLVDVSQQAPFSPIYVRLVESGPAVTE
jgi:segregation and condensation protein A